MRPLEHADIPAAMVLKDQAGWNQCFLDWDMILDASSGGCYAAEIEQKVVGTITTVTYEQKTSWLGMLLVSPAYRRQGIGTRLFQHALSAAVKHGKVWLDATPAGEPLYTRMGFVSRDALVRLWRPAKAHKIRASQADSMPASVLRWVLAYDSPIFGAQRHTILRNLYNRQPNYAFYVNQHKDASATLSGYCLGRSGTQFEQLGPVVANNIDIALVLVETALTTAPKKAFIIDIPSSNQPWITRLGSLGFTVQRPFTRMVLGQGHAASMPSQMYAIAGPEIG